MERIDSGALHAIAYAAILVMLTATPALADDSTNVDTILTQIGTDHVYVEDGVQYATSNTEASLASRLTDSDNIVLIALNDEASATIVNPEVFVQKLGEALSAKDDPVVVGVMIGDETYTYSNYIPDLANTELMHKAKTVSTNPAEVLSTYVANVHRWQLDNPLPVDSPAAGTSFGSPLYLIAGFAIGIGIYRTIRRRRHYSNIRIGIIKRPARAQVIRLLELRPKVTDRDIHEQLTQIAVDIEYYFKQRGRHTRAVTAGLANDLKRVNTVLEGYIKASANLRYYQNYQEIRNITKVSVAAIANQVFNLARHGSFEGLEKFLGAAEIIQINDPSSLFDDLT